MKKQKKIFLESEGDAWFERNHSAIQVKRIELEDPIVPAVQRCLENDAELAKKLGQEVSLLEIGCSEGKRLEYLAKNCGLKCYGIEPSAKAVALAQRNHLDVKQGTADALPFENQKFDFLVFGFCLYLCDRDDLFLISKEADRVLKSPGWIIIHDFFAPAPTHNNYIHFNGLYSFKMDYRKLFDWHPDYHCFSHEVHSHGNSGYTDETKEWVATSVLRKKAQLLTD